MLCKALSNSLDYLGSAFEQSVKLKILFVNVYTSVYDYTLRKPLLLKAAYCFRLWSAGNPQAALSLGVYPADSVITTCRQAELGDQPEKWVKVQLR